MKMIYQWLLALMLMILGTCCCAAAPLDEARFDQKLALQLWQQESVDELNKLMEGYQSQFVAEPGYERAMSYLRTMPSRCSSRRQSGSIMAQSTTSQPTMLRAHGCRRMNPKRCD
jgi:hypothetical protein